MEALKWGGAFLAAVAVLFVVFGLGAVILAGLAIGGAIITLVTVILWLTAFIRGWMEKP